MYYVTLLAGGSPGSGTPYEEAVKKAYLREMETYEKSVRRSAYDLAIDYSELVEHQRCTEINVQVLKERVALLEQWCANTPRYGR